jgi:DHA3 family tetracycline resistance protein-like MFS transporter
MSASGVYVSLSFISSLAFWLIVTVNQVYYVQQVGMNPLQLVLMGTILEVSVFVFEVPTGVMADLKSRRLSIIIGYILMGAGFILEGSIPLVWAIALAQVLWGLGYTFTSGAEEAWIADEVGEEEAGRAYLRATQWGNLGALSAIPFSVWLGGQALNLPSLAGGVGLVLIGIWLVFVMRETGFKPAPPDERSSWHKMLDTVHQAREMTRRRPLLLILLAIGLFYGLYSEGLDRLWTPHLLQNFTFPWTDRINLVTWFGLIRAIRLLSTSLSAYLLQKRLDLQSPYRIGRASQLIGLSIVLSLLAFAWIPWFWPALVVYSLIGVLRSLNYPLQTAWMNANIDDSQVRATMFSVNSLTDAVGQTVGGPIVGVVGNISIRAALSLSALLLAPVIPLYNRALGRQSKSSEATSGG